MSRFTLTLAASALVAGGAAFAQPDEPVDAAVPATPVYADADGDGIANHLDDDFERPGDGRGAMRGARGFVDEDGDGVNDLAPDADGDGIANGLDDDYQRAARDGNGEAGVRNGPGVHIDEDGDGINDLAPDTDGDGVINHLDDDYAPQGTGRGQEAGGKGQRGGKGRR